MKQGSGPIYGFSIFQFNPGTGELTKGGIPIRLQEQPARVLGRLIEKQGELVSRAELQAMLWPEGVNVDFETGLNSAVRRLRQALLDEAERPRYIETIPKRGYRLIVPVKAVELGERELGEEAGRPEIANREPAMGTGEVAEKGRDRRWMLGAALAGIGAAVGGAYLWWRPRREAAVRSTILLPAEQSTQRLNARSIAIDSEGRWLAYVAWDGKVRQIYRRSLAGGKSELVVGSAGGESPTFVPGERTLVWSRSDGIWREGTPSPTRFTKWEAEATISASRYTKNRDLLLLEPKKLPEDAEAGQAHGCRVWRWGAAASEAVDIPYGGRGLETLVPQDVWDERYVLYSSVLGPQTRTVWLLDRKTGRRKDLISPAMGGRFLAGDRLLYYWGGNLMLAEVDREAMELRSEPRVVLSGVAPGGWTGADADLSEEGTLVFVPERPFPDWRPVWVGLDGKRTPIPVPPGPYEVADMTANGRWLLLARRHSSGLATLYRYDLETGQARELVKDVETRGCWGHGGRKLAYSRVSSGEWLASLYVMDVETGAVEWRLPSAGLSLFAVEWREEGDEIYLLEGFHPKTMVDVAEVKVGQAKTKRTVAAGVGLQTHPRVSPDGRMLAYCSSEAGGMIVRELASGREQLALRDGLVPMWSADGKVLYIWTGQEMRAVAVRAGATGMELGPGRLLFAGTFVRPGNWDRHVFFDAQRERFLMALPEEEPEAPRRIELITHWTNGLS